MTVKHLTISNLALSFFILIFAFSIFFPLPTHAADTGLVQCGRQFFEASSENTQFCTICDLISLAQNLMNKAITFFAAPIAALMLGYGGFLMVIAGVRGGSSQQFTQGKKVLTNAVIGIVILFTAWLMVDTLLKSIGYSTENFGPWNVIQCESPAISEPSHFACNGDKCEKVKGFGGSECKLDSQLNNCVEHFACNTTTQACELVHTPGLDGCTQNPNNCAKKFFRCVGSACIETIGNFTESNCSSDSQCKTSVDQVLSNEEAAKALADTRVPIDSSGQCKNSDGTSVSALTNFYELKTGESLTVCNSTCKTSGTPCTKSGITANTKMMNDLVATATANPPLKYKINSIATGQHASNSDHYQGKGVDLGIVSGVDFPALKQKFLDLNTSGQIRLIQCENVSGDVVSCDSGSTRHLHVGYK